MTARELLEQLQKLPEEKLDKPVINFVYTTAGVPGSDLGEYNGIEYVDWSDNNDKLPYNCEKEGLRSGYIPELQDSHPKCDEFNLYECVFLVSYP